jgi:hypothetical protein
MLSHGTKAFKGYISCSVLRVHCAGKGSIRITEICMVVLFQAVECYPSFTCNDGPGHAFTFVI